MENADLLSPLPELNGQSLGEALLCPTRIYVKPVLKLMDQLPVHGVAHITGGGFHENIPRCLPEGMRAVVDRSSLRVPPIFDLLAKQGGIPENEMFSTFNMGVGMVLVVGREDADRALKLLHQAGEAAWLLGEVQQGEPGVQFC